MTDVDEAAAYRPTDDRNARLRRAVEASIGVAFTDGNRVDVLKNGTEIFPAMLEAIRAAQVSIEFVTFVYWTGRVAREFAAALADRARDDVRVRVVLDGFGSMPMAQELLDEMEEGGVEIERFRQPIRWKYWEADHRTHRKILVVDNAISFTGGVGIAKEWEGDARNPDEWRDTHFRIEGPASLALRATFLTDWRDTGHPTTFEDIDVEMPEPVGDVKIAVIDGSAQIGLNHAARVIEALILAARQRIWIATPYFQPLPAVIDMLIDAVHRGVDVQVLVPGPHIDKRISDIAAEDVYTPLVDEGVQVWVYQQSMMHVKAVLVDGVMSFVGSVNFNRRSISKDEEVAAAILDEAVTYELERHFVADRSVSEIDKPSVRRKPHRVVAAKLLKPLTPEM